MSDSAEIYGTVLFKKQDQVAGMIKALLSVLAAGHHVPVYKISIGGFDTHTEQLNQHARLLSVLDQTFQSLEKGLKQIGVWKESTLLAYSEFGRRPAENGSRGTDHGTANVHFAMGGTVRGGLYGKQPSLSNLDGEGNMKFTTDLNRYTLKFVRRFSKSVMPKLSKRTKSFRVFSLSLIFLRRQSRSNHKLRSLHDISSLYEMLIVACK